MDTYNSLLEKKRFPHLEYRAERLSLYIQELGGKSWHAGFLHNVLPTSELPPNLQEKPQRLEAKSQKLTTREHKRLPFTFNLLSNLPTSISPTADCVAFTSDRWRRLYQYGRLNPRRYQITLPRIGALYVKRAFPRWMNRA